MVLTDPTEISRLFSEQSSKLSNLSSKIVVLIRDFLNREGVYKPLVESRVKDVDSLVKKCVKKSKYNVLTDVTDIVGLRITTLLESEIDEVARIIEREFVVDWDNSIDKRKSIDPDRFGYLSLHYVVSIKDDRLKMIEYSEFKGIRFEIQIRSMLQNAWAEIEHDIGYKMRDDIPKHIRRKFSQAASLLEVADRYFNEIKEEIERYSTFARDDINSDVVSVDIDAISVDEFLKSDLVSKTEDEIYNISDVGRSQSLVVSDHSYKIIRDAGFKDISNLKKYYQENAGDIVKFYEISLELDNNVVSGTMTIFRGFSIFGCCYLKMVDDGVDISAYLSESTGEVDEYNYMELDFNDNTLKSLAAIGRVKEK